MTNDACVRGVPATGWRAGPGSVLVAAALLSSSCVLDTDDRCGPHQSYVASDDNCVCDEGMVVAADGEGCVACGDNQVVMGGECVCEEGYSPGTGGDCVAVPEGLGAECDPDATLACAEGDYDHCATAVDGSGYCTRQGCEADSDCDSGYQCEEGSPRYCSRPPTGQGQSCAADEDCEGFEASFCEDLITMTCAVEGCKDLGGACHGGYTCCDFSAVAPSFDFSLCVPPDQLMEGACPFGSAQIGGDQ